MKYSYSYWHKKRGQTNNIYVASKSNGLAGENNLGDKLNSPTGAEAESDSQKEQKS